MLVLKRKIGEAIKIGTDITVRILSIDHGDVKIGIEAPKNIKIFREELYEEISGANRDSLDFDVDRAKNLFKKGDKNGDNGRIDNAP